MGRRLRFLPPGGALVEVTSRTLQGRFLLQPSPAVREITLGVVGRAQRLYGMEIHAFVFLSNHYHMLVSARDAEQLARFVGYLNSNLAREVGRLHAWKEKIWGRRYTEVVVSEEEEAQVERLLYLVRQGCKEGLVANPLEWPGATSLPAMIDGSPLVGTWFDRTTECLVRRRGGAPDPRDFAQDEVVVLSPLPAWAHLAEAERRRRLRDLVELAVQEASMRSAEDGREPVGPEALESQDPYAAPVRTQERPAPLVHAASGEVRQAFREAYRLFVLAFRWASEARRSGATFPAFPEGSFAAPGWFIRPAPA